MCLGIELMHFYSYNMIFEFHSPGCLISKIINHLLSYKQYHLFAKQFQQYRSNISCFIKKKNRRKEGLSF